jgi:hypothetical protein
MADLFMERTHGRLDGKPELLRVLDKFDGHRKSVETAIAEGKAVPAEVLKDYPDLTKPPKPVEAEAPKRVDLTKPQITSAKIKIRRHYGLKRPVTEKEVLDEIANLRRKKGDFDSKDQALAASLGVGKHPIETMPAKPKGVEAKGPRRHGMVNIEPLAKTIEATVKAGKWTGEKISDAARWVWHTLGDAATFGQAREGLLKRFGAGIKSKIPAIWKAFKGWVKGEFRGATPPGVFKSKKAVADSQIAELFNAITDAKPIRKTFEEMKHLERIERAKRTKIAQMSYRGREALHRAKGEQKGEFERPEQDFEPLRDRGLTEKTLNDLIDHVHHHELMARMPDTAMSVSNALESMWLYGALPTKGELAP